MKKLIYLIGTLILVLTLSIGCTTEDKDKVDNLDKEPVDVVEDDTDEERTVEEIMNDFGDNIENSISEGKVFIDKNIDKVTALEADDMISKLINKTEMGIDAASQKLQEIDLDGEINGAYDGELYLTEEQIDSFKNEELKQELKNMYSDNYRIIYLEGDYYPMVNYEGFKNYDGYVSEEVKDYIEIKSRDANKPVALDGGLYISYDELADRIVATENYIKKYGSGDRYGEVINLYRNKLNMYLLGLPNTPMNDRDTLIINEDLMESYKKTALIKDSSTGFIVGKYVNLIEENNNIIDDNILIQGQILLEEATELIGTGK